MRLMLGILFIIGTFNIAIIIASFVTPAILTGLEILAEKPAKKPKDKTNKRRYRNYIPYPIQYLRRLLELHNRKCRIIKPQCIKGFNGYCANSRPENTSNMVSKPIPKSGINPMDYFIQVYVL